MRFLNRPIFVCAALFLFIETLSASVSLNSKCICLPPVNACSQSYRCNLNSTIYTSSQSVPSWVTPPIRDLVLATIDRVKNGTLTDFDATMACDGSDGTKVWANDCSVNGGGYLTGYGSLGFQPFGNHSGTWLTQILGQVEDPTGDPWLNSAICPGELRLQPIPPSIREQTTILLHAATIWFVSSPIQALITTTSLCISIVRPSTTRGTKTILTNSMTHQPLLVQPERLPVALELTAIRMCRFFFGCYGF